ncbi:MAG: polyhydroxyalkanoic acid synthase [Curvibacter sp.]|nr:polyhydroxyalkanoic acid synthase [Curvibacter sp.]
MTTTPEPATPASVTDNPVDSAFHAALARSTSAMSTVAPLLASADWALHLALSPGKRLELAQLALSQGRQFAEYARQSLQAAAPGEVRQCIDPPAHDRRFAAPEWQQFPYNLIHQAFLLNEQWWSAATRDVWGVEKHHADLVSFGVRQWLDMFSPGNLPFSNPVVIKKTAQEMGANLLRGTLNSLDDAERQTSHAPAAGTEAFEVGRQVAATPGRVVLRNRLIELIQYAPTTGAVHPEPVLIVPAWIMKYYILDLSPQNSLIKYLVDQGHTVFCISWKNPGAEDRDLGMDDYLSLGITAALDAVQDICPGQRVHATGYCLGGTLTTLAAAALSRDGQDRLASLSLFAAQTDFTEPGELGLFIDESQLSLLESQMNQAGYLSGGQMAGAFTMLRSNDLLWSRLVNEYLLGERPEMNDLMAWNADTTRMPARMHSQYLRRLFLDNDLAEGRYPVGGKPVSLADIHVPIFMVGTVTDHVAPWHSVYKLHHLSPAEISFVLTSGGHNAGIVSPPGHPHRHYQCLTRPANGSPLSPEDWQARATEVQGSWWPAWQAWLAAHSAAVGGLPDMGSPGHPALQAAPGHYVLEK